ncbi:SDR family NAD(P)-dependent oxidoreductase [Undibacterium sp. TJN19]|uniref:SDR family NAD(P)-dependent oxidoreductase n=1 Tax=Undibacterium sp. TJN19 TaxID=3413055 RepID=UPI003BF20E67
MRVMILGGTSGIGLALALYYLQRGDQVMVCGRDLQRLPGNIRKQYPALTCRQLDVADKMAMSQLVNEFGENGIDLLIVTAGVYYNTRHHQLDEAATMRMLQTNVSGLSHAFELVSAKMLHQRSGHMVAVSSVAGLLHDYPGASLYSATKRSVLSLCDTYRIALKPFSISVTAIVPGYIDTEKLRALNDGDASKKPFLFSEEQAVELIVAAIGARQEVLIFPWQMRWLIAVLNKLPRWLLLLRR